MTTSHGVLHAVEPVSPGAGSTADSLFGLVLMGGGAGLVLLLVLGASVYNRWRQGRAEVSPFDENTVEATRAYRRYLAASAWAGGSARNWDYSVRPVLAELVELTAARRFRDVNADLDGRARELLGPELWSLVDRKAPRTRDDLLDGAGRPALLEIVQRLEAWDDERGRSG